MSNKQFTEKYLTLVEKLMNFIAHNGKGVKALPRNASFVAFSSTDADLNKYTERILESLIEEKEDKPIVKAVEQKNSNEPWKFTTISL